MTKQNNDQTESNIKRLDQMETALKKMTDLLENVEEEMVMYVKQYEDLYEKIETLELRLKRLEQIAHID